MTGKWAGWMAVAVVAGMATAGHAAGPGGCHAPAALEAQVRERPTAKAWAAVGGWFGERQEFGCAVPAFEAAVRLDPEAARYHYFLGLSLHGAGRGKESIGELERSIALEGNALEPRLLLGLVWNEQGKVAEAEQAWEGALRVNPDSAIALDWLAKARSASGDFAGAIELLTAAKRDKQLTLDLAMAYSGAGEFDRAAGTLEAAEKASGGDLQVVTGLATVYVQAHRYQDAIALIRGALEKRPGTDELEMLLLRLEVLGGDEAGARPLAKKVLERHGKDFDALYLAGVVENDAEEYAAAAEHLKAAVALNGAHYDTRYNLGVALAKLGETEAANAEFERAVTLNPDEAQAHFHLAQTLRALGRTEEARAELEKYRLRQQAVVQTALGETKAGQAAAAMKAGKPDDAAKLYREAMDAEPAKVTYGYDLAQALGAGGHREEQVAALEAVIAAKPDFAAALNQLGELEAEDGKAKDAERHFRAALEAMPGFAEAANNLGALLGNENREGEAEVYFRQATMGNPRFAQGWVNLAATLASQGKFSEANEAVETALKVEPGNAEAARLKGMLAQVGNGKPRN